MPCIQTTRMYRARKLDHPWKGGEEEGKLNQDERRRDSITQGGP